MFVRNRREGVSDHLSQKLALERLNRHNVEESNTDSKSNSTSNESVLESAANNRHNHEYDIGDERHRTVELTFTIQPHSRSDYYLRKLMPHDKMCHTFTLHYNKEFLKINTSNANDRCKAVDDKISNSSVSLETESTNQNNKEIRVLYGEQMSAWFSFQFELIRHYLFRHFVNYILLPTLEPAKEQQRRHEEKQEMRDKIATMEMVPKFTRSELEELPARWVLQSINEMQRVEPTRRFVTPLDVNELVYLRYAQSHSAQIAENTDYIDSISNNDVNKNRSVHHKTQNVSITSKSTTLQQSSTNLCNENNDNDSITNELIYRVTDTAFMSNGEYWVEVEQLHQTNKTNNNTKEEVKDGRTILNDSSCNYGATRLRVQREMVELCRPKELYIDPFVPCDEAFAIQGTSTCIYVSLLKALMRDEQANLQNTQEQQEQQEQLTENSILEKRTGNWRNKKRYEANVNDKKDPLKSKNAIKSIQENVEMCIPREHASCTQVLSTAKRKAASLAISVALQTQTLRKTLATEFACLQKNLEFNTNLLCNVAMPLVSVKWNAKDETVCFNLAVSEHVCYRLKQLECMQQMQKNFVIEQQREEEHQNKCSPRKFYNFTLRSSVVMRLANAFDLHMSDRNKIKSKNLYIGLSAANVIDDDDDDDDDDLTANSILTNPTNTPELSSVTNEHWDDFDNKYSDKDEFYELHETTSSANNSSKELLEKENNKSEAFKEVNVMNVHDFCKFLHARSLEQNATVDSIIMNRVEMEDSECTKNDCSDANSHRKETRNKEEHEYKQEEIMMQLKSNEANSIPHQMFDLFALRVSTMCLRYRTLFGERGYNQGPHAALPEYVMNCLRHEFGITTEGFASPLNAALEHYTSLFPDTDVYFGSCGGFCDVIFTSGHVEVNPPFDTAIMRKMEKHILYCLRQSEQVSCAVEWASAQTTSRDNSLLFVIVLPSHTHLPEKESHNRKRSRNGQHSKKEITGDKFNNSNSTCFCADKSHSSNREQSTGKNQSTSYEQSCVFKTSTEYNLINSEFCLGHILCKAEDSCYVDGHQHVLHEALFCITTSTRLIILGNKTAQQLYNSTNCVNSNCNNMLQCTHCNNTNSHSSNNGVSHGSNEIQRRLENVQKAWIAFTAAAKLSSSSKSE